MGRCRVKKKKIRKNDREEGERDTDTGFFLLPSVESDYTKGAGHTCTYERGVRLPVEKKKATGQINDLASVAIFGVTFLFSRLFFFFFLPSRPLLSVDLFSFAKPKFERGSCGWSYTSFFFSHQEAETFLGKGFFRLIPSKLPVQ